MKRQQGFTLIELVVVIIILGILAVMAAPKFINLQGDARVSTLNGLRASIQTANSLIHSKAVLAGLERTSASRLIDIAGTTATTDDISIMYGYMDAASTNYSRALEASIDVVFADITSGVVSSTKNEDWVLWLDMTTTPFSIKFWQNGAPATCFITYQTASSVSTPILSNLPSASDC